MSLKNKTSSGDGHPYRKLSFWRNESNHFWETGMYTEKAKDYFRESLANMIQDERRSYIINMKS